MPLFNPYINFAGRCQEALEFYKACFGGDISAVQTYGATGMQVPDHFKDKLVHAEFRAEGITLFASDGSPDGAVVVGDNVSLSLNFTDVAEEERVFNALAAGGTVTMALHDAFWGARFGMLTDRFGIHWQLNCERSHA